MNSLHTIESFLEVIFYNFQLNLSSIDYSFVRDMHGLILANKPLTTKQLDVCVNILRKHKQALIDNQIPEHEILNVLGNKICQRPPVPSVEMINQVRYVGGNQLAFRTKYNQQIIKQLKQLKNPLDEIPQFNREEKIWLIEVSKNNLHKIMKIIKQFNIKFDDDVVAFLAQCDDSLTLPSHAELVDDKIQIIVRNDPVLDLLLKTELAWCENNV